MPASGVGSLMAYWRFYRAVAATQLSTWLADSAPAGGLIVDVSGPHLPCATQAAAAGQTVIRAVPAELAIALSPLEPAASSARSSARPLRAAADSLRAAVDCSPLRAAADSLRAAADSRPRWAATDRRPRRAATEGHSSRSHLERTRPGPIATVQADLAALPFMDDRSVDGVIADDRTLSRHLFTEQALAEIARVLRPGGRLLACFDSLVLGMAVLAEQRHWAELTDLPNAEVVLVPWPDGTITRCFGVEQLRELFAEARLEIAWIRPRTVLSPTTVEHVLNRHRTALADLVRAELAADPDDSVGIHLIVDARKKSARSARRTPRPARTQTSQAPDT